MSVTPLRRHGLPSSPEPEELPEELAAEVGAALGVAESLADTGVGLRLVTTPGLGLRVDLLDGDGTLRRSLHAAEALDLAAGRITV